jgi:16S rRNA (adenine1518-N6/adenine1519-N6)-dimethyltransferase
MTLVRAKKHLGQHFLTDKNIAAKIVESLRPGGNYHQVLEVGPGMGILSDLLLQKSEYEVFLIDIDTESYQYLQKKISCFGRPSYKRRFFGDGFCFLF